MVFIVRKPRTNIFEYPKAITEAAWNMQKRKYDYLMKFLEYLRYKRKA